jgi:hypothetical protein
MKKMLVGSVLALAVTLVSQQNASAWHEFRFGVGFDICYRGGGNCWSFSLSHYNAPYPDCCPNGGGLFVPAASFVGAGYGHAYADNGSNWQAPAPAQTAPASLPQAYSPYYNSGYQPVGYYPGYAQAPGYWYGR